MTETPLLSLNTWQQHHRDALGTEYFVFLPRWKDVLAGSTAAHVSAALTGCRRTAMSYGGALQTARVWFWFGTLPCLLAYWLYPCPRSIPLLDIANCLQWLMALITQASEEEIVQLKAKAEVDMDELINMYHQVSSLFMLQAIVGHKQMSALHVSPGLFLLVQHAILLVVTYLWWRHNTFVNLTTRTASAGRSCINKLPGACSPAADSLDAFCFQKR